MSIGAELRDHVLGWPAVATLIGGRLYPQVIAQSAVMPAAAYTVISDVPTNALCGTGLELRNVRVQIDVVARDLGAYTVANDVADAIDDAMRQPAATFKALRLNRQDRYSREPGIHEVMLEFSLWRTASP